MPYRIRCPNPEHEDSSPSCVLYEKNAYCWSGCGYISPEQFKEWTGEDFWSQERAAPSEATTRESRVAQRQTAASAVNFYHRTLVEGPRKNRLSWFHARGFSLSDIRRFRFGHTGIHFSIPIWNEEGIVGYKLRRDEKYCDPDGVKYINQKGMGVQVVRYNPRGSPTIICEGELDSYLLCVQGCDAITTTSGADSLASALRQTSGRLFLIPDADEAGEKAAQTLLAEAPDRIRLLRLPDGFGDITDYLCSFGAEERAAAVRRLFDARPDTVEASRG